MSSQYSTAQQQAYAPPNSQPTSPTPGFYSFPGPGKRQTITFPNPAAGAELVITVPGDQMWRLLSVRAKLTSSNQVANRLPGFIIDEGANAAANVYETIQETTNQTASTSRTYIGVVAGATVAAGGIDSNITLAAALTATRFFIPEMALLTMGLLPGMRIRTSTTAIQTNDTWLTPSVYAEVVTIQ